MDTKIAPPSAESSVRRRRMASSASTVGEEADKTGRPVRLFRLSDASGSLAFDLVKNGEKVELGDFKSEDVWICACTVLLTLDRISRGFTPCRRLWTSDFRLARSQYEHSGKGDVAAGGRSLSTNSWRADGSVSEVHRRRGKPRAPQCIGDRVAKLSLAIIRCVSEVTDIVVVTNLQGRHRRHLHLSWA